MNHLVAHIVDVAERKQYWKILFHLYTWSVLKSTFRKAQLGQICFFCYNLIECLNQHWRGNRLQTIYDPQFSFNFRHTAEIYCYCFVRNLVSVNSFTNTICFNIWNPESPRNCQLNTICFVILYRVVFFINKCFTDRWVYNTFNIIRFYMMGLYINLMLSVDETSTNPTFRTFILCFSLHHAGASNRYIDRFLTKSQEYSQPSLTDSTRIVKKISTDFMRSIQNSEKLKVKGENTKWKYVRHKVVNYYRQSVHDNS